MADMKGGIPILPEAEAVAARAKLRDQLKAEFRKQVYHPFRGHTNTYIVSRMSYFSLLCIPLLTFVYTSLLV